MNDVLDFTALKKARDIIRKEGIPLYPQIRQDCGCGIYGDLLKCCDYHREMLKHDIFDCDINEDDFEEFEVFGIKVMRLKHTK